jgi:CRISPR-associated protein Cas5d
MSHYEVSMEISGPTAMWTRPDTGDCPVSYPAPTYSATKGIFEAILFNQAVEVMPSRVEICSPIAYHNYFTNYGGPLRKPDQMKDGNSYQLLALVLVNTCYRLYATIVTSAEARDKMTGKTAKWAAKTTSPAHAYQEMFARRLRTGRSYYRPCLGWREFTADYVGERRPENSICESIDLVIPSMLRQVFPDGLASAKRAVFDQNVRIRSGVLEYPESHNAQ